jgi:hypothetical protein
LPPIILFILETQPTFPAPVGMSHELAPTTTFVAPRSLTHSVVSVGFVWIVWVWKCWGSYGWWVLERILCWLWSMLVGESYSPFDAYQ